MNALVQQVLITMKTEEKIKKTEKIEKERINMTDSVVHVTTYLPHYRLEKQNKE